MGSVLGVHLSSLWELFWTLGFVISFLVAMSREIGYSPVDIKPLNSMYCHRSTKLLGEGPITFTFNILVDSFTSKLLRQLSA